MSAANVHNLFFEHHGTLGLFGYYGSASMGATELAIDVLMDDLDREKTSAARVRISAEQLIKAYPDYLDAYYVAGHASYKMHDYRSAAKLFNKGLTIARAVVPPDYRGMIPWGGRENRAFLRIAKGYVESLVKLGRIMAATRFADRILRWDPQDNVGVGRILVALDIPAMA